MKIIIPAAGIGTRLRPHTHSAPKALLYVAGKPILGHILDKISSLNPSEVRIIIGFLGPKIVEYVEEHYDLNVKFVTQEELLGLGYAIYLGMDEDESEDILIVLGDTILETDWSCLLQPGRNIIGVREVDDPRRFGVVETEGTRIIGITEKPDHPSTNMAVVGAYYISDTDVFRDALRDLHERDVRTKGEIQVTDAFEHMIRNGTEMHICPIEGWYDCGKRETLLETNRYLLKKLPGEYKRDHLNGCVIIPPVYIAEDAVVEKSILGPDTSVASGCTIRNSIISDSIISAGARVENARLTSSLVGNNAYVRGSYKVLNVGDSSEISY